MKERIDIANVPSHIAVIMDGNGRWAKKKGAERIFGHRNALEAVRQTVESCADLGVDYLTLYAFSTENWSRPKNEVDALMELLVTTIRSELSILIDNNIQLASIGDLHHLPVNCQQELDEAIDLTSHHTGLKLNLALSYSGRWEIVEAFKKMAKEIQRGCLDPDEINEQVVQRHLQTAQIPDPELLIRTSGEMRISNFLLWQLAYTELYITDVLWPDFRKEHLYEAIIDYQHRERRFGKVLAEK